MAKFKVGEMAVLALPLSAYQENENAHIYDGTEVEIILVGSLMRQRHGLPSYEVRLFDGTNASVAEYALRKKKPPQESGDMKATREQGAPSFSKMMEDLNVEVV